MNGLEELALRFTQAAAHVLWIGALVALGVFVVERLVARSAATRHAVHLAGLLLTMAALPVAFMMAPEVPSVKLSAEPEVAAGRTEAPMEAVDITSRNEEVPMVEEAVVSRSAPAADGVVASPDVEPAPVRESSEIWQALAPWVAGIYAVGLLLMALRLFCGLAGSVRLRARSEPVAQRVWIDAMRRMADAVGVRVRPALRWSREVASPVVMGFFKPAVLLPVALASRLSPAQVEAVLAHELAHLHRRDTWAVAVQRIVETVLFFHPAVWWMSRRMETAREEACDDLVVAAGCDPADYAEALLVCSECRLERAGLSAKLATRLAATGEKGAPLRQRVLRLLGQGDGGSVRLGRIGWVLGVLAIGGVALVMTVDGLGRADLADFDFDDPPMGYEKNVEVADRKQVFEVDGLRFEAAPLRWEPEGWIGPPENEPGPGKELFLNLGVAGGYEVVSFRLFDHSTRKLIHDSEWQHPGSGEHGRKFHIERIGATNWVRMQETGGRFPERMDVWLRIATRESGPVLVLAAEAGASATAGGSEVVITNLMAGNMNGNGQAPTGEMRWDRTTLHDEDRALTMDLENRGKVLDGRFHLVAVKKDGVRHPMNQTHFRDFQRMGRHTYVQMRVPLDEIDHFELIPFEKRHKFFFNGLEVPERGLPDLGRYEKDRIKKWAGRLVDGDLSEKDFLLRMKRMGPGVVPEMVDLMKVGNTDRPAMDATRMFLGDPAVPRYLADRLEKRADERRVSEKLGIANWVHCCLTLLGETGEERYVDVIARFTGGADSAAMNALAEIGGEKARDHLLAAFDKTPTERWWPLARCLERLGDPAAVPELKRRLAMVELPPSERFPRATVDAFTSAITTLSGIEEGVTWHSWSQGQHFRYPFDGPGLPKTFSVDPLRDHYVKLPDVDPETTPGRMAIWKAMEEATGGPGFTLDGDEVVLLHGLKAMPVWEDGPPYPTTLHDWLNETSHRRLLERAERGARAGRMELPENGLLLAVDPAKRLYVLQLDKRTDEYVYGVSIRPLDPLRQLVADRPRGDAFTESRVCTLHDFGSGARNGALNLNRSQMMHLNQNLADDPGPDAVLFVEFHQDAVGLGVAGAGEFRLVAVERDVPADELVAALRAAGPNSTPGRERIATGRGVFHAFEKLSPGQCLGFAARMPDGVPVAGLLEVQGVDLREETVRLRYQELMTPRARRVFDGAVGTSGAVFRTIEQFARLPEDEQAAGLAGFYTGLSSRTLNWMVEGVLGSHPHDILNPHREDDPYGGNTSRWARQLEEAAKEMSIEEVAERLEHPMWIRVAARARALQVLQEHSAAVEALIARDLQTGSEDAVERATAIMVSLQLRGFSERLLEVWLAGEEGSRAARRALVFLSDPGTVDHLLERVEAQPSFLTRCSGLFQGPLAGKVAEPALLELLESKHEEIRYHAADALQECRDARLARPAARMAAEDGERFRLIAARLVANLPDAAFAGVRGELRTLLHDESDEVRFKALHAFAGRQDPATGPLILEALKGEAPSDQHKVWVVQSLSSLTGRSWNYNIHDWGPQGVGNREAIQRFEAYLASQGAAGASGSESLELKLKADGSAEWRGKRMTIDRAAEVIGPGDGRMRLEAPRDLRMKVVTGWIEALEALGYELRLSTEREEEGRDPRMKASIFSGTRRPSAD